MKPMEIFRKLFTEQELKEKLQKAKCNLQKELKDKDYRMAAFRSLDIAHLYDILEDKMKSKQYYRSTLDYLDHATFQPLWIRLECLGALGKHEEALKAASDDPHYTQLGLAILYEKAGHHDSAEKIFIELAIEQSRKPKESMVFHPLLLQYISDLWERAQNIREAQRYNLEAVKAWEEMKNNLERSLVPIEEAWLYEEIGYIYEKAAEFEMAMDYYKRAEANYELAYTKDATSSEVHYVDGDWDHYIQCFRLQLPEILMIDLSFEYFIEFDFRRIKYRIINLKEKMEVKA